MSEISRFTEIYALGKREIANIFTGEIEITEKIDGSQFAFCKNSLGELEFRSKGQVIHFENHPELFNKAIEYLTNFKDWILSNLENNTTIYCEYLQKPKHNVLSYGRVPKNNLIVFGVKEGLNLVSDYNRLETIAKILHLEVVPLIYKGTLDMTRIEDGHGGYSYRGYDLLKRLINTTPSILGGDYGIEGCVLKNYNQHTSIGQPVICCGKYVRESFKERHQKEWKTKGDTLDLWLQSFKTEARWLKAISHLKEKGELLFDPKDIGKLLKEIHVDIIKEEADEIKEYLYNEYIDKIKRTASAGFPEWYKDYLIKNSLK